MSDHATPEDRLQQLNQPMPYSDEAEKGVLSCLLTDPEALMLEAQRDLSAAAFYRVVNRAVYEAMIELHVTNKPIDLLSLTAHMRDRGTLEQVGGSAALSELYTLLGTQSLFSHYKKIITDKWLMRQQIAAGIALIESAQRHASSPDHDDAAIIVAKAEETVFRVLEAAQAKQGGLENQVVDSMTMTTLWQDAIERTIENKGKVIGLQTGWVDVDRTFHGLAPDADGDLFMIGAFPGMGKTVGAVSILEQIAVEDKVPTLIFPLEMGRVGMSHRLYLGRAGVNVAVSRNGMLSKADQAAIPGAQKDIMSSPLFWSHKSSITTAELRATVQMHVRRHGVKCVIIDHFGQLRPSSDRGINDERIGQKEIMETLHEIRRNLGVLVILFVQLDKKAREKQDRNRPPSPGDIRGASEMVEYPTQIGFIHRPAEIVPWANVEEAKKVRWGELTAGYRVDCPDHWSDARMASLINKSPEQIDYEEHARFIISKNRWGATTDDICLRFRPALQRFTGRTTHLYSSNPKNRQVILPGF
jgi:replicative DNA helicase